MFCRAEHMHAPHRRRTVASHCPPASRVAPLVLLLRAAVFCRTEHVHAPHRRRAVASHCGHPTASRVAPLVLFLRVTPRVSCRLSCLATPRRVFVCCVCPRVFGARHALDRHCTSGARVGLGRAHSRSFCAPSLYIPRGCRGCRGWQDCQLDAPLHCRPEDPSQAVCLPPSISPCACSSVGAHACAAHMTARAPQCFAAMPRPPRLAHGTPRRTRGTYTYTHTHTHTHTYAHTRTQTHARTHARPNLVPLPRGPCALATYAAGGPSSSSATAC